MHLILEVTNNNRHKDTFISSGNLELVVGIFKDKLWNLYRQYQKVGITLYFVVCYPSKRNRAQARFYFVEELIYGWKKT